MQIYTIEKTYRNGVTDRLLELYHRIFLPSVPYLLALIIALVAGGIISVAQPIVALLFVGSIGGVLLIVQPTILLWVLLLMTLVIAGTVKYFIPGLEKIWWVTYGMAAVLIIPAIMAAITRSSVRYPANFSAQSLFGWLFIVAAAFSTLINAAPVMQAALAVKSLFFFAGLWIGLAFIPISTTTMQRWLKAFLVIGAMQWLPAIYQYLFVRTSRLSGGAGVESSDSVVGTFGGSMDGGGYTATLAAYLVIMIVIVIAYYRKGLIGRIRTFGLVGLLVIPLLLMEVKIIFFYLPLSLLILFKDIALRRPMAFFGGASATALILMTTLLAYQSLHWSATGRDFGENFEQMFTYSFKEEMSPALEDEGHMSRLLSAKFWWEKHGVSEPVNLVFGHGLGASKTGGSTTGSMAAKYRPLYIDHIGLVVLLWDLGIVGLVLFVALIRTGYNRAKKLASMERLARWQRALASGLQAVIPLFLLSLIYRNDIPYGAPMMFMLMTVFGLLAWLGNQEKNNVSSNVT